MGSKVLMLFAFVAATCFGLNQANSQDNVAMAKIYSPRSNVGLAKSALASIGWQIELKRELMSRYEVRKDQMLRQVEEYRARVKSLTNELPAQVRFVDDAVRSRLIGKAMEEFLGARLDLATRESSMKQLQLMLTKEMDSKQARLIKQQSALVIDAAKLKLRLAESEYERSSKLAEKGYTTENDKAVSQYNLALAKQELESVILRAEVEGEHQNAEVAQRLTDARISIEPVKARIAEIEKFLKTFVDSSKISARIAEIQNEIENRQQDIRVLAAETFRLTQEVEELSVLKSRIEADLKKIDSEATDK